MKKLLLATVAILALGAFAVPAAFADPATGRAVGQQNRGVEDNGASGNAPGQNQTDPGDASADAPGQNK